MKKLIPVFIAIVLILLVVGIAAGVTLMDKYSYSKEKADLDEYYHLENEQDTAVLMQDELLEIKAIMRDGKYYMRMDDVQTYLNERFYVDSRENLILYTTPDDIVRTVIGEKAYTASGQENAEKYVLSMWNGEQLYVALDYINKYTNFRYEAYTQPNRIQIYKDEVPQRTLASASKNTAIRYQGGIKSDILKEIEAGEQLIILEKMDNWSKVKSEDGFIGYVENKRLTDEQAVGAEAVTAYEEPAYTNISKDYKINLGWHQVTNPEANNTLSSVVANTKSLNTISPTWFFLNDNEGGFASIASRDYVNQAHQMGLEVWGLVDNFTYDVDLYEILSSTSNRQRLISGLVESSLQLGLDGINIDFEQFEEKTGEHFIQFIRELSIPCRANNLVLSIDNYVPKDYSAYYNRKEQGIVADYVIIMGYDEHWGGGGKAGSVASIAFVEEGIQKTLEEVPAHKVINAVPFYTRIWKTADGKVTSDAVSMQSAEKFLAKHSVTADWDEETCQNYAEVQTEEGFYQVWLEDAASLEVKLNVMRLHELAGIASWKLGLEKPEIWDNIAAYVN